MSFKVGEKVKIKTWDEITGLINPNPTFFNKFGGKTARIMNINDRGSFDIEVDGEEKSVKKNSLKKITHDVEVPTKLFRMM